MAGFVQLLLTHVFVNGVVAFVLTLELRKWMRLYSSEESSAAPETMSGVLSSSMRMESTFFNDVSHLQTTLGNILIDRDQLTY